MKRSKSVDFLAFIYFFLLSSLARFPFFFVDVIAWDESTFILTGQSLLDGHLPYTELWDNKSPLLPATFALFILVLGKSIISVRLAGAICVALTAFFTYLIGTTIHSSKVGLIGGTLVVLGGSAMASNFSATLSEHIALVPMMGAMLILIKAETVPRRLFWISLLMSTATMIRLNLAYTALAVGIAAIVSFSGQKRPLTTYVWSLAVRGMIYALGELLVVAFTLVPYIITNQTSIWWQSVVLAPLRYSEYGASPFQVTKSFLRRILITISDRSDIFPPLPSGQSVITILTIFGGVLGLAIIVNYWPRFSHWERRGVVFLIIAFAGTSFSTLQGGQSHFHYVIQLIPFLSLFTALAYSLVFRNIPLWKSIPFIFLLCVYITQNTWKEYSYLAFRARLGLDLRHGPGYKIAAYLKALKAENKPIYMTTSHIAYWLVDQKPLTQTSTHPSNIAKQSIIETTIGPDATVEMALQEVLSHRPEFIVTVQDLWYLREHDTAISLLETTLNYDYTLIKEIDDVLIYRRH